MTISIFFESLKLRKNIKKNKKIGWGIFFGGAIFFSCIDKIEIEKKINLIKQFFWQGFLFLKGGQFKKIYFSQFFSCFDEIEFEKK